MIIKSMSRKVPSFGQLLGYIDREQGQEAYRIRHNLMGRSPEAIRDEFERNGKLLSRRKNGVYLYHEIISITRASGLSEREQKERLHDIAQSYIAARCRDNGSIGIKVRRVPQVCVRFVVSGASSRPLSFGYQRRCLA